MPNTVMLIGLGHLGGAILDRLVASSAVARVVAVSRNARRGRQRCDLARLTARIGGRPATVEHAAVDVTDAAALAALVERHNPQVIVHAASLRTWWLPDLFPEPARRALRAAGYGVWLPWHLRLAQCVAAGLDAAGYRGIFLNAAYPDVVNVILARSSRAPDAGVGNVDELVAKVRLAADAGAAHADHEAEIWLVAHHALQRHAFAAAVSGGPESSLGQAAPHYAAPDDERDPAQEQQWTAGERAPHRAAPDDGRDPAQERQSTAGEGTSHYAAPGYERGPALEAQSSLGEVPPYYLRVHRQGRDISAEIDAAGALLAPCPLPPGPGWGGFSAASAVAMVTAALGDAPTRLHAPGPGGLPGGYPVEVSRHGVAVADIPGLSLAAAVDINERSHRFDGIDEIGEDGSVVFVDAAATAMHDALGYECRRLDVADSAARAAELDRKFEEYAARHGVDLRSAGRRG